MAHSGGDTQTKRVFKGRCSELRGPDSPLHMWYKVAPERGTKGQVTGTMGCRVTGRANNITGGVEAEDPPSVRMKYWHDFKHWGRFYHLGSMRGETLGTLSFKIWFWTELYWKNMLLHTKMHQLKHLFVHISACVRCISQWFLDKVIHKYPNPQHIKPESVWFLLLQNDKS